MSNPDHNAPSSGEPFENTLHAWQVLSPDEQVKRFRSRLEAIPAAERERALRSVDSEEKHLEAARSARNRAPSGPLAGVPFLLKDLFDRAGEVTGAGSRLLTHIHGPRERHSRAVAALVERGAVPVGRTHMNEFAYGLDGKNAHFGGCPHPVYPERISGGSSSGSAWAVAKGLVPFALGTDTGGSVRVPAALSGVFGFRRPVDSWASDGAFPLSPTFDTAGWFTGHPRDLRLTIEALVNDSDQGKPPSVGADSHEGPLRIVWIEPATVPLHEPEAKSYWRLLSALGRGVPQNDLPAAAWLVSRSDELFHAYNIIGSSDAYAVHAQWLEEYAELYDPTVWKLIDRGRKWSSEEIAWARSKREEVWQAFHALFEEVDIVALPAVHTTAPRHEEVDLAFRQALLTLNAPASHAGLAAVSVPVIAAPHAGPPDPQGRQELTCGVQFVLPSGRERATAAALLQTVEHVYANTGGPLLAEHL